jgi:hypothetical protein
MHPKNLITTDFIDLDASSNVCVPGMKSGKTQLSSLKIQRVDYENPHIPHKKFLSYRARLN